MLLSSCSFMSTSLRSHGLQHARLLCPPIPPRVCSNSCPLSQWCFLTISSSAAHFSFCLPSFPASGYLPVSRLFALGGQSIGASAMNMNMQDWFPSGLTSLISLLSKRLSGFFSSTTIQKHQFFGAQHSLWFNSHICTWLLEIASLNSFRD